MAFARVRAENFVLLCGIPASFASSTDVSRFFCGRCGTSLFVRGVHVGDDTVVAVATLDEPALFAPTMSVHAEERIPWMMPTSQL